MSNYTKIPQRWKALMQRYGISTRMLAHASEVNLPHLYNVLNGKSSPTLSYVSKVEAILEKIVDDRKSIKVPDPLGADENY